MAEQDFKNHARYEAGYHVVLVGLVLVQLVHAMTDTSSWPWPLVNALALLIVTWYARAFALIAQDRIIRLEMRLRVQQVAPQLAPRFDTLTVRQVVALRFAGDEELAELMQAVLDGKLVKPNDIKAAVRHWRPDTLRV